MSLTTSPDRPTPAPRQRSRPARLGVLDGLSVLLAAIMTAASLGAPPVNAIGGPAVAGSERRPVPAQFGGEDRGLGAPLEPELGQEMGHVVLDRLLGQEHPLTDLPVGQALADQLQNRALL